MRCVAGLEIILNGRRSMLPATRSGVAFRNACRCSDKHVGIKTFGRTPVLVNKPDIGIIDGPVQIIVEASGF
jgi:hypothetical protein